MVCSTVHTAKMYAFRFIRLDRFPQMQFLQAARIWYISFKGLSTCNETPDKQQHKRTPQEIVKKKSMRTQQA